MDTEVRPQSRQVPLASPFWALGRLKQGVKKQYISLLFFEKLNAGLSYPHS